jgi:hypothetical protein
MKIEGKAVCVDLGTQKAQVFIKGYLNPENSGWLRQNGSQ